MSAEFKDHPKSITEARADKYNDGSMWSPRDALIALLREIDNGEIAVEHMVICFDRASEHEGRVTRSVSYRSAGPRSRHEAIGLVEASKGLMLGWID